MLQPLLLFLFFLIQTSTYILPVLSLLSHSPVFEIPNSISIVIILIAIVVFSLVKIFDILAMLVLLRPDFILFHYLVLLFFVLANYIYSACVFALTAFNIGNWILLHLCGFLIGFGSFLISLLSYSFSLLFSISDFD